MHLVSFVCRYKEEYAEAIREIEAVKSEMEAVTQKVRLGVVNGTNRMIERKCLVFTRPERRGVRYRAVLGTCCCRPRPSTGANTHVFWKCFVRVGIVDPSSPSMPRSQHKLLLNCWRFSASHACVTSILQRCTLLPVAWVPRDMNNAGDARRSPLEKPGAGARPLEHVLGELYEATAVAHRGRPSCRGVHHVCRGLRLSHQKGKLSSGSAGGGLSLRVPQGSVVLHRDPFSGRPVVGSWQAAIGHALICAVLRDAQ